MPRRVRVACVALVSALVLTQVAAAATVGGDRGPESANRTTETEQAVVQTIVLDRTPADPGRIRLTVAYDLAPDVGQLIVKTPGGATLKEAIGFENETRYDGWAYRWAGTTREPALTMTVPVNETTSAFDGANFADTGSWSLVRTAGRVQSAYLSESDREWYYSFRHPDRITTRFRADEGHVTPGMGFLGPHGSHSTTAANQSFTRRDERVTVFAAPEPIRSGGYHSGPASVWVHESHLGESSVLVHEYVHTRQTYDPTAEMAWIDEGSADYYRELVAYNQGLRSYERFRASVTTDEDASAVLTDPETWPSERAEYRKGRRVLAALDAKIRAETDGDRTLAAVFRRANDRDGKLTYEAFRRIVERVAGASLDGWLDRYVRSPAVPAVPDDPGRFALPAPKVDSDGDGLANAAERERGTDPYAVDTDGDGREDGADPAPTDPSVATTANEMAATATTAVETAGDDVGGVGTTSGDAGERAVPGFDLGLALGALAALVALLIVRRG
ncbi:hypothetical protein BRC82_07580 [Halobacteriales archaeon QS_1_67_19]|nr:MAG: hypothetical protein BRC82_07580 [Halobacteriales archaeon QS_1_67_19]